MKKITLRNRTTAGKIKQWSIWTVKERVFVEWGLEGGKLQTTDYEAKGMNIGKSNETSPSEQAELEAKALVTKKSDEGYTEGDIADSIKNTKIDWSKPLPKAFCPCKPINKLTAKFKKNGEWIAQRKRNGHCLVLHSTEVGKKHLYSRRMEPLDHLVEGDDGIQEIRSILEQLPEKSIVITEFVATLENGKEFPRAVAKIVRTEDGPSAIAKYKDHKSQGTTFELIILDVLFLRGEDVTCFNFIERTDLLDDAGLPPVQEYWDCTHYDKLREGGESYGWEGFVLRKKDDSKLTYTFNGKAERRGSYKDKFLSEEDFIITDAELGTGKNESVYARFSLAQYVDGVLKDFGHCGPGTLQFEQLQELTAELDSKKRSFPFVVEVEYQSRHEDSGKLEFPQIQRIRDDKDPKECVFEG
jgi:ATP-dependent DNA ligase